MKKLIIFSALVVAAVTATEMSIPEAAKNRNGKLFSLFSVVQFPNSQCTVSSSTSTDIMYGVCMTTDECTDRSGTADGNCASGFGVCCMFTDSTCGSTISNNCTYIQNPGYPSDYSGTTTCDITVNGADDICQIRLDFDKFQNAAPATTGLCTDMLTTTSPTGRSPPALCGNLAGSHMYIETGRQGTAAKLSMTFTGTATRNWKIKVLQIECGSPSRAPTDCVQYFTGVSGTFKSYNHPSSGTAQFLQSQDYFNCFRQEEGYCHMEVRESGTTTPDPFKLGTGTNAQKTDGACENHGIMIKSEVNLLPNGNQNTDYFCGNFLNVQGGNSVAGVARTIVTPFTVGVYAAASDQGSGTGFNLIYSQVPC